MNLVYEEESYRIRGALLEVYKELGPGFLEAVYQEALQVELAKSAIPFVPQPQLAISYKGVNLQQTYVPDLICFDKIIIELKSAKELLAQHEAQAINYLRASGFKLALLVNFSSHPKLVIRRFVRE